jgi:hypothetical protein
VICENDRLNGGSGTSSESRLFIFPRRKRAGFAWKGCLVRDLDDFDFFDLETI